MNRIVAIIRPYRLPQTREALRGCSGIVQVTAQEVRGYGMQKDHLESYSGDDVGMDFLRWSHKTQFRIVLWEYGVLKL